MTASDEKGRPWSVPTSLHEIPETGRRLELEADEKVRAAVAEALGLRALPRLEAVFEVTRRGSDGLRITGRVGATVGQTCVVTLDPIESEIEEAVELDFVPEMAADSEEMQGKGRRVEVTAEEAPEFLHGDTVDLGAVAMEFLTLGIDPYPRKAGAVFQAPPTEDTSDHPFAALASLQPGGRGGNGQ